MTTRLARRPGRVLLAVVTALALVVVATAVVVVVPNELATRPRNVAPQAVVVASSEDAGRTADKAVDGRYGSDAPADASWVAHADDRAAWLRLEWPTPQTVDRVVLYLPDAGINVASATVRFDDGSSARLDNLPKDGSGEEVRFPPRLVSSIVVTLDRTVPSEVGMGLAEIEVWTSNGQPRGALPDPLGQQLGQCSGTWTVNVIAHPDDDLLFISPDLLEEGKSGGCLLTVVVTAGDEGLGREYWRGRQDGLRAAYATLSKVQDSWTSTRAVVDGHQVVVDTLVAAPHVRLLYLGVPGGNLGGTGYPSTGQTSLAQLWDGTISGLTTVDGAAFYTHDDLVRTLRGILRTVGPTRLNTQNPTPAPGVDHSDHTQVARFVNSAVKGISSLPAPSYFVGYDTATMPPNVSGDLLAAKKRAFYAYAAHDPLVCGSDVTCLGKPYGEWLTRQYRSSK
jgi:LmbE family N-acetylglucosaminyl deacetylase